MARYSLVDVDALPGDSPGGAVRKVRRAVGGRAFGLELITVGAPVDRIYEPPSWA